MLTLNIPTTTNSLALCSHPTLSLKDTANPSPCSSTSPLASLPTELLLTLFPHLDPASLAFLARTCRRLWAAAIPLLYHSPDIPSLRALQVLARTLAQDAGLDQANPATYVNLPDYPTKRRGRAHTPTDPGTRGDADDDAAAAPLAASTDPRLLSLFESSSSSTSCRLIRHVRIVSLAAMSGKWDHSAARIYAPALETLARAVRRAYWLLTLTSPPPLSPPAYMAATPAFSPTSPSYAHSPCGFAALNLTHTWDLPDLAHLSDSTVQILALNVGPMLKAIDLEQCLGLGPNAIFSLAAHCPNLQELRVADGPRVSDASLEGLTVGCKHLLMLDCTGAEEITNVGLRAIVGGCPKLMEVKAKGCFGILMSNEEVEEMVADTGRKGLVVEVGKRQFSHPDEDEDEDEDEDDAADEEEDESVFAMGDDLEGELDLAQLDMNQDQDFGDGLDMTTLLHLNQVAHAIYEGGLGAVGPGWTILSTGESLHETANASTFEGQGEGDADEDVDQDDGFEEHLLPEDEMDRSALDVFFGTPMNLTDESVVQNAMALVDAAWGAAIGSSAATHVPIVPASLVGSTAGVARQATGQDQGAPSQPIEDEHMWTDEE